MRRGYGGRALRAAGWVLAALVGATLLVAGGTPLVMRGRFLARLVEQQSTNLCGSVKLDGGHLGLGLAPALLLQRPFDIALDGVDIREPDGGQFFRAATVRAKVAVLRNPWRVVVDRALVKDGRWRLVDKGLGQPITEAFTRLPPGGRAQCGQPSPSTGPPPEPGLKLAVRALTIENISVVLSFPRWSVALDALDAHGTVDVRTTTSRTEILFDARDITSARGGTLRIGGADNRLTTVVPFDRVSIPRVAVTADASQNLLLAVKEARTADAVLSGDALFTNVFVSKPRRVPSGMELEARWPAVGRALARTAAWAAVGERLAALNAGLRLSLHGPFEALTGSATVSGRGASARARLLQRRRYTVDLAFDNLATTALLPPAQRALLGGRLDGRLSASARLGQRPADAVVSLEAVDLALARDRADGGDHLPRRWVVSRALRPRAPDELRVTLGAVTLEAEALRVEPVRVDAPAVTWVGGIRAARERGSRALLVRASSQAGSQATFQGEIFLLPPLVRVQVDPGRAVRVDPFTLRHVGGGAIDAGGSLRFDGPVALHATIREYPVAHIPGLARAGPLRGRLDASFDLGGRAQRPSLSGTLVLTDVRWAKHRMGGGRVAFGGIPDGTRFAGQLLDGIDVRGSLRRRPEAQDFVAVTLRDVPLGPWLPAVVASLPLRASGHVVWRPRGDGPHASTTANLAVRGPGVDARAAGRLGAEAGAAGPLAGSFHARVDGPALGPWLHGGSAGRGSATVDGQVAGSIAAPHVQGVARFQGLALVWAGSPFEKVSLDGPLTIDDRTLAVGPLVARFQSGGWLRIAGPGGKGSGRIVLAARGSPLPTSEADLTVRAEGVRTSRPIAGLSLNGLALGVRVTEADQNTLRVVGDVQLGHELFQLAQRGKPSKSAHGGEPARGSSLADRVWLHLQLTGPDDAVTIGIPNMPDLTLGARCLVEGPLSAPRIVGEVKGENLYSRAALAAADWFTPRNLRRCDLGPRPQNP